MRLVHSAGDDPYINLAIEAGLFRERQETVFLWQNRPCIICGRNQNLYAEADLSFAMEKGILPVRRSTGGGTVYHDEGNLNYSLIIKEEGLKQAASMICTVLSKAGINAKLTGRNDLMVSGRKCGGTAWQIEDGWALFHGTVLINTDLEQMERVLTPSDLKLKSKGIASVRARVINLKEIQPDINEQMIMKTFETVCGMASEEICLNETMRKDAEMLRSERWIYGECADWEVSHDFRTERGTIRISLRIHDGLIRQVMVNHDYINGGICFDPESLKGMLYSPAEFCDKISALIRGKAGNV